MAVEPQVYEIFIESCTEQLAGIEDNLLELVDAAPEDAEERIADVFRAAHSIKGDAAAVGFPAVTSLAHTLENNLQQIREGSRRIDKSLVNDLLEGFDKLRSMIRLGPEAYAETTAENDEKSAEFSADKAEGPEAVAAESITRLNIPAKQLDILVDRIGQLAVAQARLNRISAEVHLPNLVMVAEEIEYLTSIMRDQVLNLRMLPISVLFPKYRRMIHDICRETGKNAELKFKGGNTELDKNVIEELNTSLVHLLRNAVVHGIEPSEERTTAGKPESGIISIQAHHSGNEAVIEIQDDGQGIDVDRLYQKALTLGLIDPSEKLTPEEKIDLIFLPGVTLKSEADAVSGRGVGMDAVKACVREMRGRIHVQTEPGKGTAFTVRLPVSTAIMDCLEVEVQSESYYIHLDFVEECLEFNASVEKRSIQDGNYNYRGSVLPLIDLNDFFTIKGKAPAIQYIVVVAAGSDRFGLVVDHVIGRKQAVLRQLSKAVGETQGIMGAAVTETGDLALILDIADLVQSAHKHAVRQNTTHDAA